MISAAEASGAPAEDLTRGELTAGPGAGPRWPSLALAGLLQQSLFLSQGKRTQSLAETPLTWQHSKRDVGP